MRLPNLTVLKFGSSVLTDQRALSAAVNEIYRFLREGQRVVAVVSAMGAATDELLGEARAFAPEPDPAALAALLATGETQSVAWLALALGRAGIPARVLDHARIGLRASGPRLDARPSGLDARSVLDALLERPVVILPGFVGVTSEGETALFGRGGSDLTALYVAQRLGAGRCRLIKDVDGVYEADPAGSDARPRRFKRLGFDDALALGGGVVQPKALQFARERRQDFEVGAPGAGVGTLICSGPSSFAGRAGPSAPEKRLRVGLLGLGTVGLGVFHELDRRKDCFEVVKVLVRDPAKQRDMGVDPELLTDDPEELLAAEVDVLVELVGGINPARAWVGSALQQGKHVVTANKALIAEHGGELERRAATGGARLLYSASVGGALPLIERVRAVASTKSIQYFEGVLNGTTNFILDRLADGADWPTAIREAQERGFAEADPSADLDGHDAAAKLVILARAAFGDDVELIWREREGIRDIDPESVRRARMRGEVLRLVASCRPTANGCVARVSLERLPREHPLGRLKGEENCLSISCKDQQLVEVSGKGAGRWPTTASVMGDLFALWRERGDLQLRNVASAG